MNFKKIFLIDGLGALLTALLLSQLLARFETIFGMPKIILYGLAGIASCFAVYSFLCYFFVEKNWQIYLKGIATANTLYCGGTVALMIYERQRLTSLGFVYFIGEILIVLILVRLELRFVSKQASDSIKKRR